ncbi:PilN domain-containing protein [Salisediminibacterium selenitireducens]|uniref:Fimbrial assembly family protein n=1 Tax=Bacillus selenitireducens (strain ATCC 700615 / DSM 15326 / MLS10) TaxID=439292 RepID=D6XT22_BACIE|nr:fimbrial assembly family protein [Salisediminibacterium selenitireducens]ADH98958.1 Fimbrial assembly family protein [[Bacillus] selenitireducens MLS10]
MAVEINLLRKGTKKTSTFRSAMILAVLVVILINLLIVYVGVQADREAAALEQERLILEQQAEALNQEIAELSVGEHQLLFDAVDEVEGMMISSSQLLLEMVRLMPEEGYMVSYDYVYPDTLSMSFIYLELPQVAYYLDALTASPYVDSVDVQTITGEAMEEAVMEDAEAEEEDLPFWYEEFLPNYFTTYDITLDVAALIDRDTDESEEEDDEEGDDDE